MPDSSEPDEEAGGEAVSVRTDGRHVAVVTINNPRSLNSITPEVAVRLHAAWEAINRDGHIRAVVITGTGSRAFCSGADLRRLVSLLTNDRQPADQWDRAVAAVRAGRARLSGRQDPTIAVTKPTVLERPLIAAINGSAIAGGMELVQATDIRIAADHAMFGLTQPKLGLFPAGVTGQLPRQLPYCHAMELLLTGRLISAERALQIGFINYGEPDGGLSQRGAVLPGSQVLPKAIEIAHQIAANSPVAVRAIRASVKACSVDKDAAIRTEAGFASEVFASEDAKEGPRAFLEKRRPEWSKL